MRYNKEKLRAGWMSALEDRCLEFGLPNDIIHKEPDSIQFWASAEYYYTCMGFTYTEAAERIYNSWKQNHKDNKK